MKPHQHDCDDSAVASQALGTNQRTWLERGKKRVGRSFPNEKLDHVLRLHDLSTQLAARGVPVQLPLTGPIEAGERFVVYYTFCDDDPRDYEGQWYAPRESPVRRSHAASIFAAFQRAGVDLIGPETPLDYPYCNTLEWLSSGQHLGTLGGQGVAALRERGFSVEIDALDEVLSELVTRAQPALQASPWGLCHGDYHSGNTIFTDDAVGQVIDFGFWIHHPLAFDLAIALELWGQDYEAAGFTVAPRHVEEFLTAYQRGGGPVNPSHSFVYILPLARLWLETHRFRGLKFPSDIEQARTIIADRVLPRLRWYLEHGEGLL